MKTNTDNMYDTKALQDCIFSNVNVDFKFVWLIT